LHQHPFRCHCHRSRRPHSPPLPHHCHLRLLGFQH
jgi:hypothetical protein